MKCSTWWRLCDGIGCMQMASRLKTTTTRERYVRVLFSFPHTHLCPFCIPTDLENFRNETSYKSSLIVSLSNDTLLTLQTSTLNLQTWTLQNMSGMPFNRLLRRDLRDLTLLSISSLPCRRNNVKGLQDIFRHLSNPWLFRWDTFKCSRGGYNILGKCICVSVSCGICY